MSDLERWIRSDAHVPAPGLLAVEHAGSGTFLGYCGLVANTVGRPDEPELAYELLRASWRRGYATEAAAAVVERARAIGYPSLASTVREWNTASLRVLEKLGFVDTLEREPDAEHGDSLLLRKTL